MFIIRIDEEGLGEQPLQQVGRWSTCYEPYGQQLSLGLILDQGR